MTNIKRAGAASLALVTTTVYIGLILTFALRALGQEGASASPAQNVAPSASNGSVGVMSLYEFWLSILVMAFGLIIVGAQTYLLRKSTQRFDSNDILRIFATTFVIAGTLLAVTAGFSGQQIAPAMGLFGTIVGYLLGQAKRTTDEAKTEKKAIR